MKTYKYISADIVAVFDEDGISRMSGLASIVPDGSIIDPADIPPPPTPQQELAQLDAENTLTQRNLRETVMLMAEAFKTVTNGAVDLPTIPGVAKVYEVEAQAAVLRGQL